VRAAGAAAEAARNAQAAARAVLAGLESGPGILWEQPAQQVEAIPISPQAPPRWQDEAPVPNHPATQQNPWAGAQPRWEEALPVSSPGAGQDVWSEMRLHPAPASAASQQYGYVSEHGRTQPNEDLKTLPYSALNHEEYALDPYDPVGSATVEPVQAIPANLIEFPREIVAPRKARPRLAEGPYYDPASDGGQLNIFEVDVDQLAPPIVVGAPNPGTVAPPEWASIELDQSRPETEEYEAAHLPAHSQHSYIDGLILQAARATAFGSQSGALTQTMPAPVARPFTNAVQENQYERFAEAHAAREAEVRPTATANELLVAPVTDRLLAFVVDGALVTLAFLAAAVVVIASTAHPPTGRIALIASSCGLILFGILYQFLFFSYAEAGTPGMRYARVALCTFNDDNPSREQMRQRIPAFLMAALPMCLGLIWALFDGDHLAWHDRLTRTYQRKY